MRFKVLPLVLLIAAIAPAPARAASSATFTPPFEVSTARWTQTDSTVLSDATATVNATWWGDVGVALSASNANPAGIGSYVGGASAEAHATFRLPAYGSETSFGTGLVAIALDGETSAAVAAGSAYGGLGVEVTCSDSTCYTGMSGCCPGCGLACPNACCPTPVLEASANGALRQVDNTSSAVVLQVPFTFSAGPCGTPADIHLSVKVSGTAAVSMVGRARASGAVRLLRVQVADGECAGPILD